VLLVGWVWLCLCPQVQDPSLTLPSSCLFRSHWQHRQREQFGMGGLGIAHLFVGLHRGADLLLSLAWSCGWTLTPFLKEMIGRCFVFELPQDGHTFDARLVCVVRHSANMLGLLLSSKEGYILYWPDIERNTKHETTINLATGRAGSQCIAVQLIAIPVRSEPIYFGAVPRY